MTCSVFLYPHTIMILKNLRLRDHEMAQQVKVIAQARRPEFDPGTHVERGKKLKPASFPPTTTSILAHP